MTRDQFPASKRSWIMSRVKSRDTTPELALRRELWRRGLRYRVDVKELPGRPDIVFMGAKVAIFIDGAFWHGKKLPAERLAQMSEYWRRKIERNMTRDAENEAKLKEMGFEVVRFLEKDVLRETARVADEVSRLIRLRLGGN